MKPNKIIVLRHGESQANVDKGLYEDTQDHLVDLTEIGEQQCLTVGRELQPLLNHNNITVWNSPYTRARRTTELVLSQIQAEVRYKEDPRLREQDWGNFYSEDEALRKKEDRKRHSYFFYRIQDGESGADVYDRISTFLETLYRDFSTDEWTDTVLISTHGITGLIFLMRYFHWSYEMYEAANKFRNCDYVVLELDPENGRYKISIDSRVNK